MCHKQSVSIRTHTFVQENKGNGHIHSKAQLSVLPEIAVKFAFIPYLPYCFFLLLTLELIPIKVQEPAPNTSFPNNIFP